MKEQELEQMDKEELLGIIKAQRFEIERLNKENENLKELCNKYEEEHNTVFNIWKKDIELIKAIESQQDY